jgi:thiamine-phosphate pyrophosphorylase
MDTNRGSERRDRLGRARLYLVTESQTSGRTTEGLLRDALGGGVDIVQLRDKKANDDELIERARTFRALCTEAGALFVLNDRPDLAVECGADGVHVGQHDGSLEEVRRAVGADMLIGLSTHSPEELTAAQSSPADYTSVGPVFETPTKPGRPATGLGFVRHAARHARKPWFAIGGIDTANAAQVAEAGAERFVVVRAIRDSPDPMGAARRLRTHLEPTEAVVGAPLA